MSDRSIGGSRFGTRPDGVDPGSHASHSGAHAQCAAANRPTGWGCSWTKVPGATTYVLQKSTDRSFEASSTAYRGADTAYKFSQPLTGGTERPTAYYRVKAIGNDSVTGQRMEQCL